MIAGKECKIYAEILEDTAIEQMVSAMAMPFVTRGALMPDAHAGYSLPIGAVVETEGMIMPAWVGYDIGCGMCAMRLDGIDPDDIKEHGQEILEEIYSTIPVGFNINDLHTPYYTIGLTEVGTLIAKEKNYRRALGSLGGGNHFIEIGVDENKEVWVVIHSGSRGVGHRIATHYMKLAHPESKAKEGHYGFHIDSQEGKDYAQDLAWALDFALANRKEMMRRVIDAVTTVLDMSCYEMDWEGLINRNHNHAEIKDGKVIHRKGATHAEEGMMGVIPGNMRDGSFIVVGKGNPDSLYSSSHGAGRVLGRKAAKRDLKLEDFQETMKGIAAKVDDDTLDESPFAYKNIFDVMDLQKELVNVVTHITPIVNIKG